MENGRRRTSQHDHKVNPRFRKEIARVPINQISAFRDKRLKLIEQLCAEKKMLAPPQPFREMQHSSERTLSSSTIQLFSLSSYPSWQSRSFAIWFIERCFNPVSCASCSQCTVLPTPGVPVMMMFGEVLISKAFFFAVRLRGNNLENEQSMYMSVNS